MRTPIAPVPVCWPLSSLAETVTSDHASAACYRRSKHVRVHAIVVPELKLRDVKRHIFGAHLVERADHAALEDRPETLNRVRVNRADNVLLGVVIHLGVRIFRQIIAVTGPSVGRQQANLVGNGFIHKINYVLRRNALENFGDDVSAPLNRADDWRLARPDATATAPLVPMLVLVFAAYPRLLHFHNAAKLNFRRDQPRADFVAHGMGRLVATEAQHALNLEGTHSLLAGKHQMGDAIPVAERLLGVLKNSPCQAREAVAVRRAFPALPVKRLVARGVVQVRIAAARAMDALRPAARNQVFWQASSSPTGKRASNWAAVICGTGLGRFAMAATLEPLA
jgi:hypothetical protein